MKKIFSKAMAALLAAAMLTSSLMTATAAQQPSSLQQMKTEFQQPPQEKKSIPLWFWNKNISEMDVDKVLEIMEHSAKESGYGGFGILPEWQNDYMSEDYFRFYGAVLEKAEELGLKMCLYDENGFPSGPAGGLLAARYPESTAKRIDMVSEDVTDGSSGALNLPEGAFMAGVAMNMDTFERIDISDGFVDQSALDPAGIKASSTYNLEPGYDVSKLFDGDKTSRWNSLSTTPGDQYVEIHFTQPVTFDKAYIHQSDIAVLQRVKRYSVDYFNGTDWVSVVTGGELGAEQTHSFDAVTTDRVRLTLGDFGPDSVTIGEFQLFSGNEQVEIPKDVIEKVNKLNYDVPEGNWKVMGFVTVSDNSNHLDYLDPQAVSNFITITHQEYYNRFPEYFGTTIDTAFYDEPAFMYITGSRTWTPSFNEEFEKANGYSPVLLYPALFMDIGEDTASARTALHGMRTEMFAKNYIGQMDDWCRAHNIKLQGHMIYEEVVNPTSIHGDLMKVFKYQEVPGVDVIGYYGYTQEAYKIISSSANNWDKSLVMSESYGAINNMPVNYLYKIAMDEYTKGINHILPHAVWYDDNPVDVTFQPELSYRNPQYAAELPKYNDYIGRLNTVLQSGRHVADIGMLYPIYDLNASYQMDGGQHNDSHFDYMQIGEQLSRNLRKDFTYLHPEVLDERCTVEGNEIRLNNETNFEQYKVMILPGAKTVSLSNMQKIKEFYEGGGKVIATTQLPYQSAEPGKDAEVVEIVKQIFGVDPTQPEQEYDIKYSASSIFNESYSAEMAFDGFIGDGSRWNAASQSGGNQWLEVDFGKPTTVNRTVLTENVPHLRITDYEIQYWDGANWQTCARGDSVGSKKENTFEEVTTTKLRLYVNKVTADSPSIEEFEVYYNDSENLALDKRATDNANQNDNGGKAYFLRKGAVARLEETLDDAFSVYDVEIPPIENLSGGNFQYIHKVVEDTDIYFIGNSSDTAVDTTIQLRGNITPSVWNPMDGSSFTPAYTHTTVDGVEVTNVTMHFDPVQSLFIVDESTEPPVPEQADKSILHTVISYAENAYASDEFKNVITDVQTSFTQALEHARSVASDTSAEQSQVDSAWQALMKEIHKLGFVQGEKSSLETLVQAAREIAGQLDKYVEAGQAEFLTALESAEAVLVSGNAMQEDVDAASSDLIEAMINLRYRADKSVLQTVLAKAAGIDTAAYTAQSVAAFQAATENAQAVNDNPDATQDEVDRAVDDLSAALDGLEPAVTTVQGDSVQTSRGGNAKTGDVAPISLLAAITLLAGAAAYSLKKKR
ncbi:MAG: glycosyl hydrolase [Massilioclostridium sp.]|nr:glycosyl hydrolase [Massilioclostridium sp.]